MSADKAGSVKPDPRSLTAGTRVRHEPTGHIATLARRKEDGTGWWNTDGSGLDDKVFRELWSVVPARVWEGPRRKIAVYNDEHWLVQIGWWLEPEQRFVPITDPLTIRGSASPVYCEDDGE